MEKWRLSSTTLNLTIDGGEWSASPLYPLGKCPKNPLYRWLDRPRSQFGRYGEKRNLLPRVLGRPVSIPTHSVEPHGYPYFSENVKCSPAESHSFLEDPANALAHRTLPSSYNISWKQNISSDVHGKTKQITLHEKVRHVQMDPNS